VSSGGVQLFGYAAAAVSCVQLIPQVLQSTRTRVTAGVSPLMWAITGAQTVAWLAFGSARGLWPTVFVNVVLVVCATAMLRMLHQGRAPGLRRAYAVLAGLVVVELAVWATLSIGALGALAAAVAALVFYPQTITAVRATDLSGLSRTTWILTVAVSGLWGVYGVALHSPTIWVTSVHNGVLAMIVLGRLLSTGRETAAPALELEPALS